MFFDSGALAVVYTKYVVGSGVLAGAACLEILRGQGVG